MYTSSVISSLKMYCSVVRFFFVILAALSNTNVPDEYEGFAAFCSQRSPIVNYDNCTNNSSIDTQEPPPTSTPSKSEPSKELEANFNKGNLQFTANFFYNVVKNNPDKSVTLSPYSVLFLLAQLALYATGITGQQLLSALNLENRNEIKNVVPAVLDSIAEQKNLTLNLAEKVYGNIKSRFSYSFQETTKDIFRAEAESIDFGNPQKAADIINKWVADHTNDKIKDLVPASALTPDTELVLTNALYFYGQWKYQFKLDDTSSRDFYVTENKTTKVDMMNQLNHFAYSESNDLNAQAIELPYNNNNLTCLIVLPRDNNGATGLVTKLLDPNALTAVRSNLHSTKVDLYLPKFKTATTIDLKDILQKLNITQLFDPNASGLSGILDEPEQIYVSAGFGKAYIEVNEAGSEAAAANAFVLTRAAAVESPPPPILFNADHPFIYYLLFNGTPFFCGLYAGN